MPEGPMSLPSGRASASDAVRAAGGAGGFACVTGGVLATACIAGVGGTLRGGDESVRAGGR